MPNRSSFAFPLLVAVALAPAGALANGHVAVGDAEPGEGASATVSTSGGAVRLRATAGGRSVSLDTSLAPNSSDAPSIPDLPSIPDVPSLPDIPSMPSMPSMPN